MATNPIKFSDLFSDDLVKKLEESSKALENIASITKEIVATTSKLSKQNPLKGYGDIKKLNQDMAMFAKTSNILKEATAQKINVDKRLLEIQTKKIDSDIKQKQLKQEAIKLTQLERKEATQLAKETERQIKAQEKVNSSYSKLSDQLNKARKSYKDLAASEKQNTEEAKNLLKEITKLDVQLKKIDADVGQFGRSVGNYSQILDGLGDSFGGLGNKIDGVISAVGKLGKSFGGLGNAAKAGLGPILVIGLAIAAFVSKIQSGIDAFKVQLGGIEGALDVIIGRLGKIGEAFIEIFKGNFTQASKLATEAFTNLGGAIAEANKEGQEIEKRRIKFAEDAILAKTRIEELTQALDDANRISNDSTLSFAERDRQSRIALEAELELRKETLKFANEALAIEEQELERLKKAGTARREDFDRVADFRVAQLKALDDLNDAEEINEQKNRERAQQELKNRIEEIQAINDVIQQGFQKQIDDERKQLEERKDISKQFEKISIDAFNREIDAVNKLVGFKLDQEELVKQAQAGTLDTYIKQLDTQNRLFGDKAQDALKKAVLGRIKDISTAQQNADKQEEEAQQRIFNIKQEIAKQEEIAIQSQLQALEEEQFSREEVIANSNERILEGFNAFNSDYRKSLNKSFEDEKNGLRKQFALKEQLIKNEADLEKKSIENSVFDNETKFQKLKTLDDKLKLDLKKNQQDQIEALDSSLDAQTEALVAIKEKQKEIILDYANKALDGISNELQRESELRQEALDKQISERNDNISRQQALAERGLANTLAFEQAQQAKDELRKEELKEKEIKRQKEIAFLKIFAGYAGEEPPSQALTKAIADSALVSIISGSFYEGSEKIKDDIKSPVFSGKDGYVVRVDGEERVVDGKNNSKMGNISNDDLADLAFKFNNGLLIPSYSMPETSSLSSNIVESLQLHQWATQNKLLNEKLSNIEKAIASKPVPSLKLDNMHNLIYEEVSNGVREVTKKITSRPRF